MNLEALEIELKKRWQFPYDWKGTKQTNELDLQTRFIYQIKSFDSLLQKIESLSNPIQNYALNRWYNFWSATGVEYIFSQHSKVQPNKNSYDKLVDFTIDGISFDHKTSVFPKGFSKTIQEAQNNPNELLHWLYDNQSSQGRQHFKNRLFLILHHQNNDHWKLKAELKFLKNKIDNYVLNFDNQNLFTIEKNQQKIISDIIWVIQ